ncbi:MAG TPA: hypothetical protein VGJ84_10240 [Polyangiaceae bacterium]|jgi:hypothetical protein
MKLKVFKVLWGMHGDTPEEQMKLIKEAGYDGVEGGIMPFDGPRYLEHIARYELEHIPMIMTEGPDHLASFRSQLKVFASWKPLQITSLSAKDNLPIREQIAFFRGALEAEQEYGVPVAHETQRGRALCNPWSTAEILDAVPGLKLAADFAHWMCVCESTLEDYPEVAIACERALHLHGRIGYEQGPQVPDPRAPEYQRHVERHEALWDMVLAAHRRAGRTTLTFDPDFGAPDYMHTLPYTRQPVASLWDITLWMADRFRRRFAAADGIGQALGADRNEPGVRASS